MFRCDQAHRAVGKAVGRAHVGHRVPSVGLHEGDELRDGFIRLRLGLVLGIEQWNQCEIRGALSHRLELLAIERRHAGHPHAVDHVGQQQNFDAAGAEAFEVREDSSCA